MARGPAAWLRNSSVRRALSVTTVGVGAAALTSTAGAWAPFAAALDLVDGSADRSFARLRCASFLTAWTSLESLGVAAATGLWVTGRSNDIDAHYALQRWWADRLVDALRVTANLRIEVDGIDALDGGPLVLCPRHTSIADALLPVWLLGQRGMRPRYVLKDDLTIDPCLDIVGNRLPNHFVDREAADSANDLVALEQLAAGMRDHDAAVIYPEGVVVSEARRARAVEAIARRDPERAARVAQLRLLAPVRPSGTAALLRGSPGADVVFLMHTGFEPLAELGRAPSAVPLRDPVRVQLRRVRRDAIPLADDEQFTRWFDDEWAACDARLAPTPARRAHSVSAR